MRGKHASLLICGLLCASTAWAQSPEEDLELVRRHETKMQSVIKKVEPAFVFIGGGSGVLISEDGLMLTNHHVAGSRPNWEVFLTGGKRYQAKTVGSDPRGDITLLKLEGEGPFPHVTLGNSDVLKTGERVLAVGNPIGIGYADYSPTYTQGYVSVQNRNHANYTDAVQTDAPINPGNSGGPLFNFRGELVGINGQIQTRFQSRVNSGVGYAISVEQIKLWLPRLKAAKGGSVPHATAGGLRVRNAMDDKGGAVVRSVSGSAQEAGIKAGDRVRAIDGRKVYNPARFAGLIGMYPGSSTVTMTIEREGATKDFKVQLGDRATRGNRGNRGNRRNNPNPNPNTPRAGGPYMGAVLANAPGGQGVLIQQAVPEGPFVKSGGKTNDIITAFGDKPVRNTNQLIPLLRASKVGDKVSLKILRDGKEMTLDFTVGTRPRQPR